MFSRYVYLVNNDGKYKMGIKFQVGCAEKSTPVAPRIPCFSGLDAPRTPNLGPFLGRLIHWIESLSMTGCVGQVVIIYYLA